MGFGCSALSPQNSHTFSVRFFFSSNCHQFSASIEKYCLYTKWVRIPKAVYCFWILPVVWLFHVKILEMVRISIHPMLWKFVANWCNDNRLVVSWSWRSAFNFSRKVPSLPEKTLSVSWIRQFLLLFIIHPSDTLLRFSAERFHSPIDLYCLSRTGFYY